MWLGLLAGMAMIGTGIAWLAFLGRLSIRRYHGNRRLYRGLNGFLAGFAVWPAKYDTLAIIVQSGLLLGFGFMILMKSI
jgi:hypothetical protein